MSDHNNAVKGVSEMSAVIAEDAGNRINAALENKERLGKTDLSKTLAEKHGVDAGFVFAVISGYMKLRGDLESTKGPGGGIGYVGQSRAVSEEAATMIECATGMVDALQPGKSRLSVTKLSQNVAAELEGSELETYRVLGKWLKDRAKTVRDIVLHKGPGGGIEKLAQPLPPPVETEETTDDTQE